MSQDPNASDPLREELRTAVEALAATVQALTQATQVLRTTADQLSHAVPGGAVPAAGAPQVTIDTWEDDPFSERTPTPMPVTADPVSQSLGGTSAGNLLWRISDPRPSAEAHPPATREFRYWNAEFTMEHAIDFWAALVPQGTRWSTFGSTLPVALDVGQDLNANYSRPFGLRFYHRTVQGVPVFSGGSPDIIRHELGHALLDALRPELFDAASYEVDAFHEAFGDVAAMLAALQLPTFRQRLVQEAPDGLKVNSRLSRLAEQLGWGIRQLTPDAVDRDCLRNAANRFRYQTPTSLPDLAPASVLSSAPHSFARVFTGASLDAIAAMVDVIGGQSDDNLETVSRDLGQLLVDGVLAASVSPTFYSQVAAAMVQAAKVRNGGRYAAALRGAFVERGLLDLVAARTLEAAEVPSFQPAAGSGGSVRGVAPGSSGMSGNGSSVRLGYGAVSSEGYRADASEAPGLPLVSVHAEFLDQPVSCHAPAEPERFAVAPSVYGPTETGSDATESAKRYLATLIRLGRIDPGPVPGMVRGATKHDPEHRTHRLEAGPGGLVLKRTQFMCLCRPTKGTGTP